MITGFPDVRALLETGRQRLVRVMFHAYASIVSTHSICLAIATASLQAASSPAESSPAERASDA